MEECPEKNREDKHTQSYYSNRYRIWEWSLVQVEVFWVMKPHNFVVGYQCFRGLCCLHLRGEVNGVAGGSVDIWNVHTLPQHFTGSQPSRPPFESSPLWEPQILHRTSCWGEYLEPWESYKRMEKITLWHS
jgi:hypothetical protein